MDAAYNYDWAVATLRPASIKRMSLNLRHTGSPKFFASLKYPTAIEWAVLLVKL